MPAELSHTPLVIYLVWCPPNQYKSFQNTYNRWVVIVVYMDSGNRSVNYCMGIQTGAACTTLFIGVGQSNSFGATLNCPQPSVSEAYTMVSVYDSNFFVGLIRHKYWPFINHYATSLGQQVALLVISLDKTIWFCLWIKPLDSHKLSLKFFSSYNSQASPLSIYYTVCFNIVIASANGKFNNVACEKHCIRKLS